MKIINKYLKGHIMKINLRKLVEKYILHEDVLQHMGALINYFTNKPVAFGMPSVRRDLATFLEQPDVYDQLFDATGEFVDLNTVDRDEGVAEQMFNALPPESQNNFQTTYNDKKSTDPLTEPAHKIIKMKKQLPSDTLIVRFLDDDDLERVKRGGFELGTDIMDRLHASKMYTKTTGGYIFGYPANSKEAKRQAETSTVGQTYGGNCAFFKYPALMVNHPLDGEDQAIAYGPDIQGDECVFAKGVEDGKFVILNGGFNNEPKTYDEVVKLLGKI